MDAIASDLSIKKDTIQKAIKQKRLILQEPVEVEQKAIVATKSSRSLIDNQTTMGRACNNTVERVLSSVNGISASIKFDNQTDLSCAGVLLSLPALLSSGLLRHSEDFKLGSGYYSEESVFLCLAFLTLLRIKNLNQTDRVDSGELGRTLGLDRIPEVKTLRRRIARFTEKVAPREWSEKLCREWMNADKDMAGVLYIDGHVNIYYGRATKMPRRYVSRLRLCMSGSTDYYVNDKTGQPFFVVNKAINTGMIEEIKNDILPRLEEDVPNQPTEEEIAADPLLHKFMLVCDRECYSIDFFHYLWEKRVAICTYKKNVKDLWPEEEFTDCEVIEDDVVIEKMKLAEREVSLSNKDAKNPKQVKCREVRKLSKSGHQTAIITTNHKLTILAIGLYMFARWCQENFFKYMRESFDLDGLVSYSKAMIDETNELANPQYRMLENKLKSLNGKLSRQKAKFGNIILKSEDLEGKKLKKAIAKKAVIHQDIEILESKIAVIKEDKTNTDRKITFKALPESEQFTNAINERKHFMDNIKMIAYRAETSMYRLIKGQINKHHSDEGRKLLQRIYTSDADIIPDYKNKTLTVNLHHLNYRKDDKVATYLCEKLNETETEFPGTDLRLIYKMVSS